MEKEQITWRSFINSEAAAEQWNNPGTPMYYVIDPQGMIRYKWFGYPGAKALDGALEKLIGDVEGKERKRPQ